MTISTVQQGVLTAVGPGLTIQQEGDFNALIWGTFVGTVQLERSFDNGQTWLLCSLNTSGDGAIYTTPISLTVFEPEGGVLYRWRCTAFTSGTINYRISK